MLEQLCSLNQTPPPDLPIRTVPPADLSFLYDKKSSQELQIEQALIQAQRQDLDLSYTEAEEMVTLQRVNRVKAFREIYAHAFDLPVDKEILSRFARNKLISMLPDMTDPADMTKTVKLLGEHKNVQAFTKEQTLNITVDTPDDLKERIREKLRSIIPAIANGSETPP